MKKLLFIVVMTFLATTIAKAQLIIIEDLITVDSMQIIDPPPMAPIPSVGAMVMESYGYADNRDDELKLVNYTSHDGYAVVNNDDTYFDKRIINFDPNPFGPFDMHFHITNNTDYIWSDYHFEFWNTLWNDRVNILPGPFDSDVFDQIDFTGNEVHFFSETATIDPGETGMFLLSFLLENPDVPDFGIRQVATAAPTHGAVPIPGAVWLLGSGFIALVGLRKKFKK